MGAVTREPRLLSSLEVCRRTGCTFRQLVHWIDTGLVVAAVPARGSGTQRRFDSAEVQWVKLIVQMRSAGVGLDVIKTEIGRGRLRQTLEDLERQLRACRRGLPAWTDEPQDGAEYRRMALA